MGADVQNWCVSLSLKSRVDKQEGWMTEREQRVAYARTEGFAFPLFHIFLFVSFLFECVKNCLLPVHASFHFQLQDHLHLKFGFRLLKGRNYLQCANVNVECNCPGDWWYIISRVFVEVLYFNSVSLPSLLQAQFTPLLSPKRKGNRGDRDVPRGVTNLYPSGVFKDSYLY